MAREETSSRTRYGRGQRGGRQNYEPNYEHTYGYAGDEPDYVRGWEGEGPYRGEQTRAWRGGSGRDYGQQFRPSWPEQRGSYGEREYGQSDQSVYGSQSDFDPRWYGNQSQYGQGYGPPGYNQGGYGYPGYDRGYGRQGYARYGQGQQPAGMRERIYSWPRESMGMGVNMPYYGGAQYGPSPYGGAYPQPWGGQVGFGAGQPGYPYYLRHTYGYEYPEAAEYQQGGGRWFGGTHDQPSYAGRGPKGYKRADDRIHEEVCEKLTRDPWIDASQIDVSVKDGEVKLDGHVHDRRVKHMVEDAVASVSGVREIHNRIKVERHEPGFKGELMGERRTENGREFDETGTRSRTREVGGKR